MEKKAENIIDNALSSVFGNVSSQICIINIGASIVLIILGIILIAPKSSSPKKVKKNIGLICVGLGILSLISGVIQILF